MLFRAKRLGERGREGRREGGRDVGREGVQTEANRKVGKDKENKR